MPLKNSVVATKNGVSHASQRIAIVFPGQGSQSVGMLKELSEMYPIVEQTFDEASQALGFDLWAICFDDAQLAKTENTQPALLAASMAIWRILQTNTDIKPVVLAGHSLGEYSALCAAGVLSLSDAVRLVHARGQYMQEAVVGLDAKMAAILGLANKQVINLCEQINATFGGQDTFISPANFNSPKQVVVAGNANGLQALSQQMQCTGKRVVPLKVSVPSHCELMQSASDRLAVELDKCELQLPSIPVIQNRHAAIEKTKQNIKIALIEQLSHPVLWTQTMQKMASKHINLLIECGPGTVLSNLAKRQETPITAFATDKPARIDKLFKELS